MLPRPEFLEGFKLVTAAPAFQDRYDGKLKVDLNRDFEFGGMKWKLHASPLAPDYSIHTRIGPYNQEGAVETDFWLDWHDLSASNTARLLTFIGKWGDVPFEVKQERIERLAQAIQAYNSIMTADHPSSKSKLESDINGGNLPKPEQVVLVWHGNTDRMGLEHLARSLELGEEGEFSLPWDDLLDLARSGKLVEEWNRLAREEGDVMFAEEEEDPDAPEIFGKDDFCQAVTGHEASSLREMFDEDFVKPIDQMTPGGRDMPRYTSDQIVDQWLIFMTLPIRAPLLPLSRDELYGYVYRFWKARDYTDRYDRQNFEDYWLPTFQRIESAYLDNDDRGVREGIIELVEKILKY